MAVVQIIHSQSLYMEMAVTQDTKVQVIDMQIATIQVMQVAIVQDADFPFVHLEMPVVQDIEVQAIDMATAAVQKAQMAAAQHIVSQS